MVSNLIPFSEGTMTAMELITRKILQIAIENMINPFASKKIMIKLIRIIIDRNILQLPG
jgi:hypothetical protein